MLQHQKSQIVLSWVPVSPTPSQAAQLLGGHGAAKDSTNKRHANQHASSCSSPLTPLRNLGVSNWMLHRTSPVGEPTRGSLGKATPHRNKMTNRTKPSCPLIQSCTLHSTFLNCSSIACIRQATLRWFACVINCCTDPSAASYNVA